MTATNTARCFNCVVQTDMSILSNLPLRCTRTRTVLRTNFPNELSVSKLRQVGSLLPPALLVFDGHGAPATRSPLPDAVFLDRRIFKGSGGTEAQGCLDLVLKSPALSSQLEGWLLREGKCAMCSRHEDGPDRDTP